jgi:hypothetical protein
MPMQRKHASRGPWPPSRKLVGGLLALALLAVVAGIVATQLLGPTPPPGTITSPATTYAPLPGMSISCTATDRAVASYGTTSLQTLRTLTVPDYKTYDLRGTTIVGYPTVNHYPLAFGKRVPGSRTCVLGGTVVGRQNRALTWQYMKHNLDGDALNFKSVGGLVDGLRVHNIEDGVGLIGSDPDGLAMRNVYMTYIRDDCIENDAVVGLDVQDSLFDGCFMGLSERPGAHADPSPAPLGEQTVLDRALVRLQPMPYDASLARCGRDGLGTGGFFKWSPYANHLFVKDSILFAERVPARCGAVLNFPSNGTYQNVTVVWTGPGNYPGKLPASGVTVTRDRAVWDNARADWLTRHGYPVTDPPATPLG